LSELVSIESTEVDAAEINICTNGIMHIHVKVKGVFSIEHSKEIVAARTSLAGNRKYPVLYTLEDAFLTPSKEVSQYVASDERSTLIIADAFIVESFPQRLAARAYRLFSKPVRPTAFFSTKGKAIQWLQSFI